MFADAFERFAGRPCVSRGDDRLTYAEAIALGRRLIDALPRRRMFVALRVSLTVESLAAYAALLEAGHVPLLLEDSLSDELFAAIVNTYAPNAELAPGRYLRLFDERPATKLHDELGLLLTTSGSTGSAKLVRVSAGGLLANARAIADYLSLGPGERAFLHLPFSYSYGMSVINSHLIAGGEICLARHSVMEEGYWADLARLSATSMSGVPFHYRTIRRLGERKLETPSLRTLTQAGGRLEPELIRHFAEWADRTGRHFVTMYGQTEAGPRITYLPPERAAEAPDSIGIPIPGVNITLVGDDGAAVPDGETGEILCESPAVMMGYALGSEDLELGDVMQGRLMTGDLARRGADGLLRIVGRRSRLIKIFGLRINVDEVEQQLRSQGFDLHCFGEDDRLRVLVAGAEPAEVRDFMTATFSLPPRGVEIRRIEALPTARTGKVAASALSQAWEEAHR